MKAPKEIYVPLVDMGVEDGGIQPAPIWWNKDKSMEKQDCKGVIRYVLADLSENDNEPKKGYDEKYLQSCIDKAKKSWEGVDTDKFMDEIREREDAPNEEMDNAAEKYAQDETMSGLAERAFKAGAEWQRERMEDEHGKELLYVCQKTAEREHRSGVREGKAQAEKELTPLINRLCEAILFEWKDAADLARKTLTQIKAREEEK